MNISGIVVRAHPEYVPPIIQALGDLDGVEVHGAADDGRMVVTVEAEQEAGLSERVLQMHDLPHVLSVSMIYHHFEEE